MRGLIFTYGLTGTGTWAGLLNLFYGLLVYITFAILKPDMMWPWAVPAGRYSLIVALSMLIGWGISKQADFKLGKSWICIAFLETFLAWESKQIWQKGISLFFALMMGHAVLFSFSRGEMLAMAIMGAVAFVVIPKRPRTYAMLLAAVAVVWGWRAPKFASDS